MTMPRTWFVVKDARSRPLIGRIGRFVNLEDIGTNEEMHQFAASNGPAKAQRTNGLVCCQFQYQRPHNRVKRLSSIGLYDMIVTNVWEE